MGRAARDVRVELHRAWEFELIMQEYSQIIKAFSKAVAKCCADRHGRRAHARAHILPPTGPTRWRAGPPVPVGVVRKYRLRRLATAAAAFTEAPMS